MTDSLQVTDINVYFEFEPARSKSETCLSQMSHYQPLLTQGATFDELSCIEDGEFMEELFTQVLYFSLKFSYSFLFTFTQLHK